jgi:hypothetical protein
MIHVQIPPAKLKEIKKAFQELSERELPFATALTLTTVAKHAKKDLSDVIPRVFRNPTPFTRNAVFMKPANKKEQKALVWLKDWTPKGTPAARYLSAQVFGGERKQKPSEKLLRRRGFLDADQAWVPGFGMRLNQYGNPSQGQIQKIISALGSQNDPYQNTTKRSMRRNPSQANIFYSEMGGSPGVYSRGPRGSLSKLMAFTQGASLPRYKKQYPFFLIAEKTINRRMLSSAQEAIGRVIATRR